VSTGGENKDAQWRHGWESSHMSTPVPADSPQLSLAASPPLAIVTGGSRGLGYEVARGLAAKGYHLALVAQNEHGLITTCNSFSTCYCPWCDE